MAAAETLGGDDEHVVHDDSSDEQMHPMPNDDKNASMEKS